MNLRKLARGKECSKISVCCDLCHTRYRKRADRVRTPDFCCLACRNLAAARKREERSLNCAYCGVSFIPRIYQISHGGGRYCSLKCSTTARIGARNGPEAKAKAIATYRANGHDKNRKRGPDHPQFYGRKICGGYVWIWNKERGYVQEHRLIMERKLDRPLVEVEIVHHINRDRTDNRIENLELMSRSEHAKEHSKESVAARRGVKLTNGRKLNVSTVQAIKSELRSGGSTSALALKYGITPTMVCYIKSGKSWAHVV